MKSQYETAIHTLFEKMWNSGRVELADEIFTSHCTHDLGEHAPDFGGGPDAQKEFINLIRSGLQNLHLDIDEAAAEANRVTVRWTANGRHTGRLMGIPPSGRKVTYRGVSELQFDGEKIADHKMDWESGALLMQLAGKG